MIANQLKLALLNSADKDDAIFLQRFFKTGVGQYGAGDVFIGVRVPAIRKVCQQYESLALGELQELLDSKVHEERLAALIIMTKQFSVSNEQQKYSIYNLYLKNLEKRRINNWDLVDVSAEYITGEYLRDKPRDLLFKLARSDNLWQRRVAIVSSFAYIKRGEPDTTLKLAELLLHDKEDLIQKAVGWMLREVGKRCGREQLVAFLDQHAQIMPRTMLRYSLEHFPQDQRLKYMKKQTVK